MVTKWGSALALVYCLFSLPFMGWYVVSTASTTLTQAERQGTVLAQEITAGVHHLLKGAPAELKSQAYIAQLSHSFAQGRWGYLRLTGPRGEVHFERSLPRDDPRHALRWADVSWGEPAVQRLSLEGVDGWTLHHKLAMGEANAVLQAKVTDALTAWSLITGMLGAVGAVALHVAVSPWRELAANIRDWTPEVRYNAWDEDELAQLQKGLPALHAREQKIAMQLAELTALHQHHLYKDELTKLDNRLGFERRLSHLRQQDALMRRSSMVWVVIDNLDAFNDQGYAHGNAAMTEVARALTRTCQPWLRFAGRIRGGTLAFVLDSATDGLPQQQAVLAEVMTGVCEDTSKGPALRWYLVTMGLSPGMTQRDIMGQMDVALARQRHGYVQDDSSTPGRLPSQWSALLDEVLAQPRWALHVQKVKDSTLGHVLHAELLLLVHDSRGDEVPTGDFLAMAHRLGRTWSIDMRMLNTAVQCVNMSPAGSRLALNVCVPTVQDARWLSALAAAVHNLEGGAERLIIELRLPDDTRDWPALEQICMAMQAVGVGVGLDACDWRQPGWGGWRWRPLYIKCTDVRAQHDLPAGEWLQWAHEQGVPLVGQRVETEDDLRRWLTRGIDALQGHWVGKPTVLLAA